MKIQIRIIGMGLCLLLFTFSNLGIAGSTFPPGNYFIKNYSPREYKAFSQNWSVVEDQMGIMYFANNDGVLQYDGVNWNLIKIPGEKMVRSLAVDNKGIVYVGSIGEFGFLASDHTGQLQYLPFLQD